MQRCLKFIENDHSNEHVNATLTIPGMKVAKGSDLKLTFFTELISIETEFGEVCTRDHRIFYMFDIHRRIDENEPLNIDFILTFDSQADKPELKEIYIGRKWFCVERDSEDNVMNMTDADLMNGSNTGKDFFQIIWNDRFKYITYIL